MAKRRAGVEEIFGEAAIDFGWSKKKQLEILLGFIEEQELEAELEAYIEAIGEDDDTEEAEPDPFVDYPEDE